ncbi:MAG TPA: glycosyltransferase family 4 protein [Planctomycetota bacterium]|nr:glycosyltransferase family 4 protein [Planctomycetota bacterium]
MATRILHVTEACRIAGTEQSLLMLLDNSDRVQFEHVVVCRGEGMLKDEVERRGARAVVITRLGKADPLALLRFGGLVARLQPHIVHIYGGRLEAVVAKALGVPVVERKNVCRNSYYRPLINFRAADHMLARCVDVSISPAEAVKSHYVERGYDPQTISVVYNGVSPAPRREKDHAAKKRAELGIGPNCFLVAFAGRMVQAKGVDVLLAAMAQVPDCVSCVLVGDGPHAAEYCRQADALGLGAKAVFTGYRHDTRDIFACADVVAVPSRSEPLANVVLEAMAEGKPVIATEVEGMPEAVEHEVNGLLVPPDDCSVLAAAITRLAADPDEARRMGAAGLAHAHSVLSPERMARETEEIYRRLLQTVNERKCNAARCR